MDDFELLFAAAHQQRAMGAGSRAAVEEQQPGPCEGGGGSAEKFPAGSNVVALRMVRAQNPVSFVWKGVLGTEAAETASVCFVCGGYAFVLDGPAVVWSAIFRPR